MLSKQIFYFTWAIIGFVVLALIIKGSMASSMLTQKDNYNFVDFVNALNKYGYANA